MPKSIAIRDLKVRSLTCGKCGLVTLAPNWQEYALRLEALVDKLRAENAAIKEELAARERLMTIL